MPEEVRVRRFYCFITVRVRSKMEETFKKPDVHSLQKSMKDLYDQGLFTDIKINVGGVIFSAHKPVLYSNSTTLKNMLTNETADKYKEEIELKGLDVEYFKPVLHYMYTETIKKTSHYS